MIGAAIRRAFGRKRKGEKRALASGTVIRCGLCEQTGLELPPGVSRETVERFQKLRRDYPNYHEWLELIYDFLNVPFPLCPLCRGQAVIVLEKEWSR